jgi:hypothetical protein
MHFKGAFVGETKISIFMMMMLGRFGTLFRPFFGTRQSFKKKTPLTAIRIDPLGGMRGVGKYCLKMKYK